MTRPAHLVDDEGDDDEEVTDVPHLETRDVYLGVEERPTIAKAIIAFVTTLSGTLITALAENGITATEWVTIATSSLVAALAVYSVTNKRA